MFPDYSFHYYYEPHEPLEPYCKSLLSSYLLKQAGPHHFFFIYILKSRLLVTPPHVCSGFPLPVAYMTLGLHNLLSPTLSVMARLVSKIIL